MALKQSTGVRTAADHMPRGGLSFRGLTLILALLPLAAFGWLISQVPALSAGSMRTLRVAWMPALGLDFSFYLDGLSALFALLVTGIGTLVLIYAGYYFEGRRSDWRFPAYLLLFMTSMLGLVLAGDLITLFVFWEGTSVTSFLLVAFKTYDASARRGAFKALFITAGGGVALLAAALLIQAAAGSVAFADLLSAGPLLTVHPWYPAILGLMALAAFTKSAQVPAHIWLPDAMAAPTPASAYLHSATMVKAGIYLLARLNPVLGFTDTWFWLLSLVGLATMLTGAYLGLKQNDLKGLLAYSTISQLGVLVMLIGQDSSVAFKALVIGVLAHALYKSAAFLVVGIVDHETGTRDLRELGGLAQRMPRTAAVAAVAALSMAGLPPLFGFLAKETLLATVTHPSVPALVDVLFPAAAVAAGALILAQAAMLLVDTFLGRPQHTPAGHEPPWGMLAAAAIPALLSLTIGLLPEPLALASFLAAAAGNAFGDTVKVSLALWTGINPPLLLSLLAVSLGSLVFVFRRPLRHAQGAVSENWTFNRLYQAVLSLVDAGAGLATRTQGGYLRHYMLTMLATLGLLILVWGRLPLVPALSTTLPVTEPALLSVFTLFLAVAAMAASVVLRRDLLAILAMGAGGLSVAVSMILEPAPDVALVQIVVDILSVIVLVLALTRLPRAQRVRAGLGRPPRQVTRAQRRRGLARDLLVALGGGLLVATISFVALTSRPRPSAVTPFYEVNAKPLAGAADIVGAIVVDFRGFDTLIEIVVFAVAGLGIYSLLRYAVQRPTDPARQPAPARGPRTWASVHPRREALAADVRGLGRGRGSAFARVWAGLLLPVMLVLAATHIMYGHEQPGDGFTAGVIVSLAVAVWYIVYGYAETRARLPWLRPTILLGGGLLLALVNGSVPSLWGKPFFAHLDYGKLLGLPLPAGFSLSTGFFFELAIALVVLAGATFTLAALGHPQDDDEEGET